MNIVCHAFPAWDGDYVKSTVELMKATAALGHRILYVDYAYTWTDFFKSLLGKGHASWRRMLGLEPRLRTINGLSVLSLPPVLPANFLKNPRLHDAVNQVNAWFIGKYIRRAMHTLHLDSPTVINAFNPGFGLPLVGKLGEKQLLYYCYDEIGAAAWAGRHGKRLEATFVKKCSAVIVSSEGLFEKQKARHRSVHLVKNGVDTTLFGCDVPDKNLPFIPGRKANEKVIGYLGSIDDRLDLQLLIRLFQKFPQTRFVFVGRVQNETLKTQLTAFPNVYLVGAFPPADLPDWVASMDVCLIPFVKNEFTAGIYPMKINEYLAAGKPVVSTDFAPLDEFSDVATVATDHTEFECAVSAALFEQDPAVTLKRQQFARQNSWTARAEQLIAICAASSPVDVGLTNQLLRSEAAVGG